MKNYAIGVVLTIILMSAVAYIALSQACWEVRDNSKANYLGERGAELHQHHYKSLVLLDKQGGAKYEGILEQLRKDDKRQVRNISQGRSSETEKEYATEPKTSDKSEPNVAEPVGHEKVAPKTLDIKMTYYTASCHGCSGITRSGYDVRNTVHYEGMRVVAVDPNVIPLYSIVEFEHEGDIVRAIALDTGGAIKGNRMDMLVRSKDKAFALGKQSKEVTIIREGR